jgi:glycyl-tRNA synthetase beta chain
VKNLLIEIGTEEIPARFIEPEKEGLLKLMKDGFSSARVPVGEIEIQGTPRRLTVLVRDVAEKQEETLIVKFGPPANRAFDQSGAPTKAAEGFARSQGVTVDELTRREKDGVEFLTVEKLETGAPAGRILPDLIRDAIARIPFQKKMRWGSESFEYARPIQWLLVLLGEDAVIFDVADVSSGRITYGHRFLSKGAIDIPEPLRYRDILRANYVITDEVERMEVIRNGIKRIEEETGGRAVRDEELVREILYITEYPYPLTGTFDELFLNIPKEVLVNVMKSHQKYIPMEDEKGSLKPCFIFFANTVPADDRQVIKGNEKVLRARLADAQFFFQEDRRTKLRDLYEKLSAIIFHVKLGTLKEKTERVLVISRYLAGPLQVEREDWIESTVRLMKTDLVTHMVGEFPELQGVMGRIYANYQGEEREVATAIEEHYLPAGGSGALPVTVLGATLSVADKIDSLTAFFSVGIIPTGNLDPFALRRQTLGVMRILIDRKVRLPLKELIRTAYDAGRNIGKRESLETTSTSLTDFVVTRFKFSMLEEGHNQDFVESVLPCVAEDIYDGYTRLLALENQKSLKDFERLMVGFRRVFNITKQLTEDMPVDPALFNQEEEAELFDLYEARKRAFFHGMREARYDDALSILVGFKETIDSFFNKVFVMDKDEAIKMNRLGLLKNVKDMFLTYGDFSKIRVE